jgi:hypothetical protein
MARSVYASNILDNYPNLIQANARKTDEKKEVPKKHFRDSREGFPYRNYELRCCARIVSELTSDKAYFQSTLASHAKELSACQRELAEANKKEAVAVQALAQVEAQEKLLQVLHIPMLSLRGALH